MRDPPLAQVAEILKLMGDCRADGDEHDAAARLYRAAAAVDPESPAGYLGLGSLALQEDQLEAAVEFFSAAAGVDPGCSEAYSGLAITYHRQGRYPQALRMYLECLRLDGDNLLALLGLFKVSNLMGSFSEIIRYLRAYLDKHPQDASVMFCLASLYAREGRLEEARATAVEALRLRPDKAEARELIEQLDRVQAATP